MNFDFYTQNSKYTIKNNCILRNGEIMVEGKVFLVQLLFGYPAIIYIGDNPSTVIRTSRVQSVLPKNEFLDGQRAPAKTNYQIDFVEEGKHLRYKLIAVDDTHAIELINWIYHSPYILSVKPLTDISKGELVC